MPTARGPLQRITLRPHPSQHSGPLTHLTVDIDTTAEGIRLAYTLAGDIARLRLPSRVEPGPADGLWAHTCCEAFIAAADSPVYREFNFSPSGQWAIYDFADYRVPGGVPSDRLDIRGTHDARCLTVKVWLPRTILPSARDGALVVGLTCVVEDRDGEHTYWAISHPAERPDFHHRGGFALRVTLPPAVTA